MELLRGVISAFLGILKWVILARVVIAWLPRFGVHIDSYHPIVRLLYRITDPILRPLQRYSRVGMIDLSPVIAFLLISLIQDFMLGRPISQTIAFAIVLVIAFSVHEFAHAWAALQLGDPTAKNAGRLTLDPRKHLDVLGSLMVLAVGFGWAKPVPVNPDYLRNGPKEGMAMVAAAGPLSNLALAIIAAVVLHLGLIETYYASSILPSPQQIVITFVWLNVALFVFNLLPIAPLDGSRVVAGFLPYPASEALRRLEPVGPVILLLLVFLVPGLIRIPTDLLVGLMV
jgi:Zn-dependent protease